MDNSKRPHKARPTETEEQRQARLAYHREWMRKFRKAHPEKQREANRRYRENNLEKIKLRYAERYARDRKKIIASVCEYSRRNRTKINERNRKRYHEDVEEARRKSRKSYVRRHELSEDKKRDVREKHAAYMRKKRNADPTFLVADRLRRRINSVISSAGIGKTGGLVDVSGCTVQELVSHIERQFVDGMSWQNRRQWHIDHIVPCSAFDLTDPAQQLVAFHYTNLRPVWSHENLSKQARIPGGQMQWVWDASHVRRAAKSVRKKKAK
jgi:hypothetical protein